MNNKLGLLQPLGTDKVFDFIGMFWCMALVYFMTVIIVINISVFNLELIFFKDLIKRTSFNNGKRWEFEQITPLGAVWSGSTLLAKELTALHNFMES